MWVRVVPCSCPVLHLHSFYGLDWPFATYLQIMVVIMIINKMWCKGEETDAREKVDEETHEVPLSLFKLFIADT